MSEWERAPVGGPSEYEPVNVRLLGKVKPFTLGLLLGGLVVLTCYELVLEPRIEPQGERIARLEEALRKLEEPTGEMREIRLEAGRAE